jgi:ABC-type antimicrobial peptide transport system permease subunit
VRMALGAGRGDVVRLILRQALIVIAIGAVAGLGLAAAASRLVASQLFEVRPLDPLTLAAASALLAMIACTAAYIPARRAARMDPTRALRVE